MTAQLLDAGPFVFLDDQLSDTSRLYQNPVEIITAYDAPQVHAALETMQARRDQGYYLAGVIAYEAGYALEPRLRRFLKGGSTAPLIAMGVFEDFKSGAAVDLSAYQETAPQDIALVPDLAQAAYQAKFDRVKDYIRAGDVYQINLTFPMRAQYGGSAMELFTRLRARQPVHYGGVVSLAGPEIISVSPELFFKIDQSSHIELRPMKGTAPRDLEAAADRASAEALRGDEKSRAENLMIVDLLRNDVSHIAKRGSVKAASLFQIETYPTLHQMTSSVTAELRDGAQISDIIKSLFPCGSVTGAPKIRAMEIIHELEDGPRQSYCGALGYFDPGGESCFNVAIRTARLSDGKMVYPVGSGIVLDSHGADEYAECLLKAKLLMPVSDTARPKLIETLRWSPEAGAVHAAWHLARLSASAAALGYDFDEERAAELLRRIDQAAEQRARLTLSAQGELDITYSNYAPLQTPLTFALSARPLSRAVQETRYKVSARDFYDGERARLHDLTGCHEVVLFNPDGDLCEGSFTSIFLVKDGQMRTPDLSSGLLPGVLRQMLIDNGHAQAALLSYDDLISADEIYLGNSLRGLMPAKLISLKRL